MGDTTTLPSLAPKGEAHPEALGQDHQHQPPNDQPNRKRASRGLADHLGAVRSVGAETQPTQNRLAGPLELTGQKSVTQVVASSHYLLFG